MAQKDEINLLAATALGQTKDLVDTLRRWKALAGDGALFLGQPADSLQVIVRNLAGRVIERGAYLTGNQEKDQEIMHAIRYPDDRSTTDLQAKGLADIDGRAITLTRRAEKNLGVG